MLNVEGCHLQLKEMSIRGVHMLVYVTDRIKFNQCSTVNCFDLCSGLNDVESIDEITGCVTGCQCQLDSGNEGQNEMQCLTDGCAQNCPGREYREIRNPNDPVCY